MFHNSILILNQGPQAFGSRQQNLRCENFEWWIQRIALLVKIKEQHSTVIPSDSHSGFYFPPSGEPDNPMVQTIRPESFESSFQTKGTQDICMLSCIPTRWYQLSPIRFLNFLYMAGRSAFNKEILYKLLPHWFFIADRPAIHRTLRKCGQS